MEKAAYWQYLKNSLELEDFILPEKTVATHLYNAGGELGFFLEEPGWSEEERTLFEKMIGAMGLSLDRVGLFFAKEADDSSLICKTRVVFSNDPLATSLGTWQESQGLRIFTTHSLKNLIENPLLKKSTWEHLKIVRDTLNQ
jgi:hypothetical protein